MINSGVPFKYDLTSSYYVLCMYDDYHLHKLIASRNWVERDSRG